MQTTQLQHENIYPCQKLSKCMFPLILIQLIQIVLLYSCRNVVSRKLTLMLQQNNFRCKWHHVFYMTTPKEIHTLSKWFANIYIIMTFIIRAVWVTLYWFHKVIVDIPMIKMFWYRQRWKLLPALNWNIGNFGCSRCWILFKIPSFTIVNFQINFNVVVNSILTSV